MKTARALNKALTQQSFDAVMHFAAFIEAGESMKDPGRFYFNNLSNSLSLIETAHLAGISRFVFSSTAAVYRSSDAPLTEDLPLGPTNVYGHTKLMVEQALDWYRQVHGLHFAALRYFNACGALPGARGGPSARVRTSSPACSALPWAKVIPPPSSVPTIPPRMAPASGTMSISRIWSMRICWL